MQQSRVSGPETQAAPQWQLDTRDNASILTLSGTWLARTGNIPAFPENGLDKAHKGTQLSFDTAHITDWDTGLIAFLWDLKRVGHDADIALDMQSLPAPVRQLLQLLPDAPQDAPAPHAKRMPVLEKIGQSSISSLEEVGTVSELAALTAKGAFQAVRGRSRMRFVDILANTADAGPYALLIVGVVNFLIGAILAFVGAVELQKFAAGVYVASLVGIAMVREMAAVMTAIIMAGRTGGSYAARISTMQGNEEIDALNVFGITPSTYLILPAVLSLVITMPFLYLYGCLIGILGGFIVSISMLDLTPAGYFHQTFISFGVGQFVFGFVKSIVFGAFIGLTSCRIGLKAGRSAADVGIAATRAVVVGIVGVIAIDAIFAVLADVIGI
ncbi:MlaE family ABC transporter permease [Gluconobacter wancherniae]|uniref:MlaE family ABC transporter permease n=1 Tax=Gluconobacter wancherniae TaxID=1307955 RepID=UPI001B8D6CA6|nr:ABC transporter permease [Gluconobacter wancherniae]MBS1087465.1 ABC transporter permease [Gluconobacter wancherniae]